VSGERQQRLRKPVTARLVLARAGFHGAAEIRIASLLAPALRSSTGLRDNHSMILP
jgi:hypothetical protein